MTMLTRDELRILTITLQVVHVPCGNMLVLHGDNWRDVHGTCRHCGREYDVEFFPRYADEPPRSFRRRRRGQR